MLALDNRFIKSRAGKNQIKTNITQAYVGDVEPLYKEKSFELGVCVCVSCYAFITIQPIVASETNSVDQTGVHWLIYSTAAL